MFYLKNKNYEQTIDLNELILCSYYQKVIKFMKKNNFNYDKRKVNTKKLFDTKEKNIFKNLISNEQ